jgi:hypothetical protein
MHDGAGDQNKALLTEDGEGKSDERGTAVRTEFAGDDRHDSVGDPAREARGHNFREAWPRNGRWRKVAVPDLCRPEQDHQPKSLPQRGERQRPEHHAPDLELGRDGHAGPVDPTPDQLTAWHFAGAAHRAEREQAREGLAAYAERRGWDPLDVHLAEHGLTSPDFLGPYVPISEMVQSTITIPLEEYWRLKRAAGESL